MTRRHLTALLASAAIRVSSAAEEADGSELIGKPAPRLALPVWLNSKPLDIADRRGKVVLLRWWTEGCPYCAATAPALNDLSERYRRRGLQVIGVYHPKPPGKWTLEAVRHAVDEKQFTFPIAVDSDWSALRRWWLTKDRDYTSVSFLLDREGIIRYIHPGGEFHEGEQGGMPKHAACNRELAAIRRNIDVLLGDPART